MKSKFIHLAKKVILLLAMLLLYLSFTLVPLALVLVLLVVVFSRWIVMVLLQLFHRRGFLCSSFAFPPLLLFSPSLFI